MPKILLSWALGCSDQAMVERGSTSPSAFILRAPSPAKMLSLFILLFFNMTFLVLNNLWKLFGNSEHSSSHNAWNLKINGRWFRAWEIRVQNQAGFMVTSEIKLKKKKEIPRPEVMTFNPCSKQGALESLCVHACTASTWMHAYVCFTPSERRVNISMPLQGRKEISLQQVGTTKHQRHSKDLGQAASVTGLAGQTRGFKLTPGCRPLCLCWRAQLSWMWLLFTDWAISHLLCSDPRQSSYMPAWISLGCYNLEGLSPTLLS